MWNDNKEGSATSIWEISNYCLLVQITAVANASRPAKGRCLCFCGKERLPPLSRGGADRVDWRDDFGGGRAQAWVAEKLAVVAAPRALARFGKAAYTLVREDVIFVVLSLIRNHFRRRRLMGWKRTSRRELLKGGAALTGGLTLGVPVHEIGR